MEIYCFGQLLCGSDYRRSSLPIAEMRPHGSAIIGVDMHAWNAQVFQPLAANRAFVRSIDAARREPGMRRMSKQLDRKLVESHLRITVPVVTFEGSAQK